MSSLFCLKACCVAMKTDEERKREKPLGGSESLKEKNRIALRVM